LINLLAQMTQERSWADHIDALARTPLSKVVLFVGICTLLRLAVVPVLAKTPIHRRGGGYSAARVLNEVLDAIIYAGVFVFLLIRPFGIQAFRIPSGSMLDTLQINDFIVANKAIYRYTDPKFGDIVVFRPPVHGILNPEHLDSDGQVVVDYIKRCVGTPGDVVELRSGVLYLNGQPVEEPYVRRQDIADFKLVKFQNQYWPLRIVGDTVNADGNTAVPYRLSPGDYEMMNKLRELPPAALPPGGYLMIGDNRTQSFDSRSWGIVTRDQIVGRSEFVWLPLNRWGRTR
jgi:signal peptidase I